MPEANWRSTPLGQMVDRGRLLSGDHSGRLRQTSIARRAYAQWRGMVNGPALPPEP